MTYRVEIDQSGITAPNFPRSTEWWRDYLPTWYIESESGKSPTRQNADGITVNGQSNAVVIQGGSYRHSARVVECLLRSTLSRYMTDPSNQIKVLSND